MEATLKIFLKHKGVYFSTLHLDGVFQCFCMGPLAKMIPPGVYTLKWEFSPRFKCNLWEFKDVPGHSEIKIHAGNDLLDTDGCLLMGYSVSEYGQIWSSLMALSELHKKTAGLVEMKITAEDRC